MKTLLRSIILLTGAVSSLFAVESTIKGIARDEATHKPLIGANVIVEGTQMGAATDVNGEFVIPDVPPGFYHIRFEMMGYQPLVKLNVRVIPERGVFVAAELVQQAVELEEVTVTRAYYQKQKDAVVSSRTVDFEEIRRDPSGYDIQKMMQALPSVVSTADQQNEIVVRGGSPGENLFLMDNIEIANPNHFGFQGTGGGPINMLNTLFVDRVDFLAGAFPAKYGDKASSVMDVKLREGSHEAHALDLDMTMAGVGFFAEGPVAKGRGSYMGSYRKSYLDLIIRSTGLVAVPRYWNGQAKVAYEISPSKRLELNFIHGKDEITIEHENTPITRGAENVDVDGNQSAIGLTYKRLWSSEGLSRFTLAGTRAQFIYDVYRFSGKGQKISYYTQDETEWDLQARGDFLWRFSPDLEISGGIDLKRIGADFTSRADRDTVWIHAYTWPENPDSFVVPGLQTWENHVFPVIEGSDPDSIYLDEKNVRHFGRQKVDGTWEYVRVARSGIDRIYPGRPLRHVDESFFRYGAFFQAKWRPFSRITMNLGLRLGYFDYTGFGWVSPRFGASYHLTDRSTLNVALGRHFQSPSLVSLMEVEENRNLRSKYADQIVLGLEHFFSEVTRGTVEIYGKKYHDVAIPVWLTTLDTADREIGWINKGQGYSYGIEFFLQKKLAKDFFGTFSYSNYVAMARDVRYPDRKKFFPWDFDFRNVLTAIGGYKLPIRGHMWKRVEDRGRLARVLAHTLGSGAQELEVSFRYRFVGGRPYTPRVYNHVVRRWYEERGVEYNTKRVPPYHRFDIMILWHYDFGRISLVSFLDIQNVFDRDNVWDIQRNGDGTTENVYQYKVMPVGGFTLEF